MFINALENALIINRPEVNEQIYFGKIKHYKPHMQGLLLESIDNKSVLLVCGLWNNADFAQGIYLRLNL